MWFFSFLSKGQETGFKSLMNRELQSKLWGTISHHSEQSLTKRLLTINAAEDLEKPDGHTFAFGSVNWEQPGHRTAGSFLQKVNRSYHSILPLQCWDSADGRYIIRKDTYTPVFTATIFITCQDACIHRVHFQRWMNTWCGHTHTHTYTNTQTSIYTYSLAYDTTIKKYAKCLFQQHEQRCWW